METILNCTPESFVANEKNYKHILDDHNNWRQIPLINHISLDNLRDTSVVRFRGMVQDMLDPEIYLEEYEVNSRGNGEKVRMQQGKYRDCLQVSPEESVNHDSDDNAHGERRTLFVVSVPGFNNWALDIEKKHASSLNEKQNTIISNKTKCSQGVKRPCNGEQSMDVDTASNEESSTTHKRIKSHNVTNMSNCGLSSEYLLNSPISDRPGKACMVKIYTDFEKYTLNTVVDVVGFLSVDPVLDGSTMESDENEFEDMNEIQASNPPPSLIPRIHAIVVKKLEHTNPLLDLSIASVINEYNNSNMISMHKDLKLVLTQCLFGDALSAEYLICHLISTVYVRTDVETLGQFSLNFCNIPGASYKKYTEEFYDIIGSMLTASHYLPLTLDNLNSKSFVPTKDYATNKLVSGLLQLASHTHLILDETQLQPGKLESSGITAVQSLAGLIKNQQIKYNFKFYDLNFDTDIPVMILSEGRSMLPNNFQVPLNADPENVSLIEETLKAAKHYVQPKLNDIRVYLTRSKLSKFDLNPEDSQIIENDFVEMRKLNPKTDADVLHKHLVLSRLLGIARGYQYFNKNCWEMAKEMEKERVDRLNRLPKSRNTLN